MISFTFHAGNHCVRRIAEPILRRYGMVGTVGAICDLVFWDQSRAHNFMRPEGLLYLVEAGWEIASHSLFHRRMTLLPPSYEDEAASWRRDGVSGCWIAETQSEDVAFRRPLADHRSRREPERRARRHTGASRAIAQGSEACAGRVD